MRPTRTTPVERPAIERVQSTATGATDGSIIAAIMSTHSARKRANERPIVPGPIPMSVACWAVMTHAMAASAVRAIHGGISWRSGRLCVGRAVVTGPARSAVASPRQPSYRKSVMKLFVPENSTSQWPW